ncbi:MAP kinase kinase kinase win1 [Tolypocladium paradoxum]|uniref:MAP kinase kinase kinase win1 n=1 Tax=Tolypocladium paradoxum TaxID=94208 RepID=A0A2S4KZ97_9HYPO|nr:MAP kinase kinase kinase win1 [Tolypocladium paradoxum]
MALIWLTVMSAGMIGALALPCPGQAREFEAARLHMAPPQIARWEDLAMVSEEFDEGSGEFRYTTFGAVDEDADVLYFGRLNRRMRRGCVTGIVLDRQPRSLANYLKREGGTVDRVAFMEALESAAHHLHSLSRAHNDLNPSNIIVTEAGMPVIIDFGSCHRVGDKLTMSRATRSGLTGRWGTTPLQRGGMMSRL